MAITFLNALFTAIVGLLLFLVTKELYLFLYKTAFHPCYLFFYFRYQGIPAGGAFIPFFGSAFKYKSYTQQDKQLHFYSELFNRAKHHDDNTRNEDVGCFVYQFGPWT